MFKNSIELDSEFAVHELGIVGSYLEAVIEGITDENNDRAFYLRLLQNSLKKIRAVSNKIERSVRADGTEIETGAL